MKLVTKLIVGFLLIILSVLGVDALILYRSNVENYETDMKSDLESVGLAMKFAVEDAWENWGERRTLEFIDDANLDSSRISIRFVWLDLPPENAHGATIPVDKIALSGRGHSSSFTGDNGEFTYVYFPVSVDNNRAAALEFSESLAFLRQHTHTAITRIAVLSVTLLILAFAFSALISLRVIGRPLNLLLGKIQRIGDGDYSDPLLLPGNNELSELSAGINKMCTQIEDAKERLLAETESRIVALEQLRHEDRLKTVGRLASGIAHELGTPLNVISGRAAMISRSSPAPTNIKENADIIKKQCDRIASMFRQLLDFARQRPTRKSSLDIQNMLQDTLNLMKPLGFKQNIQFSFVGGDTPLTGNVDAEQLQQVMMNLTTNAIQAMPEGGNIEVGLHRLRAHPPEGYEDSDDEYICVYIQDQGQGIAEENIPHIFEPFFTTKDIGEGTGLGLSIVHGIVHENGGWIEVESELNKGSRFSIYLPEETK